MHYLRVQWLHAHPDEPVDIYMEMDEAGWEVRKVEIFPDGSIGLAGPAGATHGTRLGERPVPPLETIATDPQFRPAPISQEEFERVWAQHCWPIEAT